MLQLIFFYIFLEILTCKKADIFIELHTVLIVDYVHPARLNQACLA